MPKISKKHHYIPQCHLRGFLNDQGSFFIFDKKTGKLRETNTADVLFEKDRNTTISLDGHKSDWLEKVYNSLENKIAPIFNEINTEKGRHRFSNSNKLNLGLYIATLYWRLPVTDHISEKIKKDRGLAATPFNLFRKDGSSATETEKKQILATKGMEKAYRLLLTFASIHNQDYLKQIFSWKFLFNDPGYFLICDNPIIKDGEIDDVDVLNKFVMPLSKECLLINNEFVPVNRLPKYFFIQMGVAMFHQAERFVCCHDRNFLEHIIKYYDDVYKKFDKTESIIPELFNMLTHSGTTR